MQRITFYLKAIAVCLLVIIVRSECCAEDKAMDERIRAIWNAPSRQLAAETWKRTKGERETIIREFKARLNGNDPDEVRQNLMLLGDLDATKIEVQKMVADSDHRNRGFQASGSPIVVQYLAPHIYSEEAYSMSGGDNPYPPFSFRVSNMILGVLSDSSAFTGEVTNWARHTQMPDPVSQRKELQHWWEENKIHFEQEDYKAVKPGLPIASIFEVEDENRRKAGLPPLERRRPKQPMSELPPAAQKPASAAEPAHFSNSLYYIAAALAALLAALLVILARRKR